MRALSVWVGGTSIMCGELYTEHCAACSNQTQTVRVYPNADSSLRKHEDLTQCCFNVGPAPLAMGQYWNSIGSNPRVCWELHTGVCLHPPLPSIIFSPADQGTFSKTAGHSQAYYNTWNWERGTYDVTHLHILTCEMIRMFCLPQNQMADPSDLSPVQVYRRLAKIRQEPAFRKGVMVYHVINKHIFSFIRFRPGRVLSRSSKEV